jgi:hypothetical protein
MPVSKGEKFKLGHYHKEYIDSVNIITAPPGRGESTVPEGAIEPGGGNPVLTCPHRPRCGEAGKGSHLLLYRIMCTL